MKRWSVSYSEHRIMETVIEAKTKKEAEQMVFDGNFDFENVKELDAEITSVNDIEYLDG